MSLLCPIESLSSGHHTHFDAIIQHGDDYIEIILHHWASDLALAKYDRTNTIASMS